METWDPGAGLRRRRRGTCPEERSAISHTGEQGGGGVLEDMGRAVWPHADVSPKSRSNTVCCFEL